jgi:hypothetical protein
LLDRDVNSIKASRNSSNVISKLIVFSLLILIVPLVSYFVSLKYIFRGTTSHCIDLLFIESGELPSAIVAVVCVNVILVAYLIAAVLEDQNYNS